MQIEFKVLSPNRAIRTFQKANEGPCLANIVHGDLKPVFAVLCCTGLMRGYPGSRSNLSRCRSVD